jgi:hypothetical protein
MNRNIIDEADLCISTVFGKHKADLFACISAAKFGLYARKFEEAISVFWKERLSAESPDLSRFYLDCGPNTCLWDFKLTVVLRLMQRCLLHGFTFYAIPVPGKAVAELVEVLLHDIRNHRGGFKPELLSGVGPMSDLLRRGGI